MLEFDHIAITADTLEEGAGLVEATLGVAPAGGGRHPLMGTHNRLLSLGPGEYLEVITIDPAAPKPERARWFALDERQGPARLTNWIARCRGAAQVVPQLAPGAGRALDLARDDLRWTMVVPDDGRWPYDGAHPGLIEWPEDQPHPANALPDLGLRLVGLRIGHPHAQDLRALMRGKLADPRIEFHTTQTPELEAHIKTPAGIKVLS